MADKFRLRVMSLVRTLFDDEVESVFLQGDEGEYELLPFHYPLIGALVDSDIRVSNQPALRIRSGVVLFDNNTCIILVEEQNIEKFLYPGQKAGEEKKK